MTIPNPRKKSETQSIFGETLNGDLSEYPQWVFGQSRKGFTFLNGDWKENHVTIPSPRKKSETPSIFGETLKGELPAYRLWIFSQSR